MKTIIAIAAAIAFTGSAAVAQEQGDRATVRVSYADLDLNYAAGRSALEGRVSGAVRHVCPMPSHMDSRAMTQFHNCRSHAWAGARQQLAAVYGRGQYAGLTALQAANGDSAH
jgi:UrcA family protein